MTDLILIVVLTVISCAAAGAIGIAMLHAIRSRPLRDQLVVATLVPVLTVVVAVVINVELMFISPHDSIVVSVALAISVLLALVTALLIRRRLIRASRLVGEGLGKLVADSSQDNSPTRAAAKAPTIPGAADSGPGNFEASSFRTTGPPDSAVPTAPDSEAPAEFAAILAELSETRRTLAEARDREHAAEQARRELISFMSHDLRTPLAGLRAIAEGLEDGVIDDVPQALAHVRQTVARMTVLVDDLFALSRVTEPQLARPRTLVSLTELLTDVAVSTEAAAAARGVTVRTSVPATDRLAVLGSADDLARALGNLAANAIRHTEPGSSIRLEAGRAADGHVQVAVVDGCGGIPDDHLGRVFDTGWRGTPARGDDGGAGLGLAIARGVVESHAGQITVRNVTGGCRFELSLPGSAP